MVYLFIGEDIIDSAGTSKKDTVLKSIKAQFLAGGLEDFNRDSLYAKGLTLKELQETLLFFPVKNKQRIVIIKDAQNLKEDLREFLLEYLKKPSASTILVLDIVRPDKKDDFVARLSRHAKTFRFKEIARPDAFLLNRHIEQKRMEQALGVLNQLLKDGEKPERILGGLRYAWERDAHQPLAARRKLKLLLNCDIDIKTGRLKPVFALEKLVIGLCSLR